MSEMDYGALDGELDMRFPDLDPEGEYELELVKIQNFKSREDVDMLIAEFVVRASNKAGSPVGSRRQWKQSDCFGRAKADNKKLKVTGTVAFLAAISGKDSGEKQKWSEICQYAAKKNVWGQNFKDVKGNLHRGGAGVFFRCKTGVRKPTRNGGMFTPHIFTALAAE
jgi:hypothetical protein